MKSAVVTASERHEAQLLDPRPDDAGRIRGDARTMAELIEQWLESPASKIFLRFRTRRGRNGRRAEKLLKAYAGLDVELSLGDRLAGHSMSYLLDRIALGAGIERETIRESLHTGYWRKGLASVLEGVLAQRLGRRVCQHCRHQVPLLEEVEHRIAGEELSLFDGKLWEGAGCDKCNRTGYYGRIGFFELLTIGGPLRRAISENRPTSELSDLAGPTYRTMRRDGVEKAARGLTTIEEVLRATQDAEDSAV